MATNNKRARSAETGKFVTEEYAKKHPKTTVIEKISSTEPRKKEKGK